VPATIHQPPGAERFRPVPPDLPGSATGRRPAVGLFVAVGPAAAGGLVLGLLMPRGPASTGAALAGMVVGLTIGGVAGAALRSRWAMLIAPVVFAVAFELVRIGAVGPTVDAPRLSVLGILAFLLGRGFDGVLILLPMILGASLGAAGPAGPPRAGGPSTVAGVGPDRRDGRSRRSRPSRSWRSRSPSPSPHAPHRSSDPMVSPSRTAWRSSPPSRSAGTTNA
jgi:hypothetical protein